MEQNRLPPKLGYFLLLFPPSPNQQSSLLSFIHHLFISISPPLSTITLYFSNPQVLAIVLSSCYSMQLRHKNESNGLQMITQFKLLIKNLIIHLVLGIQLNHIASSTDQAFTNLILCFKLLVHLKILNHPRRLSPYLR